MKVLVACEESQAVCIAFRERGHEAYSCDLQECSGGHSEWHLKYDIFDVLGWIKVKEFDLMIAFPPCTDLAVSGAAWFERKRKDGSQQKSIDFFMALANCHIEKIAIENPIGIMSSIYRKPDQIIQPWQFGDPVPKKTCLWLKGLPPLLPTQIVQPEYVIYNSSKTKSGKSKYSVFGRLGKGHGKERSKTFPGIARAMAEQWG